MIWILEQLLACIIILAIVAAVFAAYCFIGHKIKKIINRKGKDGEQNDN